MSRLFNNFYRGKRILITGHTGFKGSWISIWLRKLGANVVGYALEPPTTPSLFEICNLKDRITSIIGDIRNINMLKDVFDKHQPEIVFHMAAQSLVRYSYKEPVETYQTNVIGTVNTLETCRHTPSVRVIANITSDKCYENREWIWGYREIDQIGGYDPYSSSKGCAELVTSAYLKSFLNPDNYEEHGISLASIRAGNIIGGGDWAEDRLVPDCIKALLRNRPIVIRYPNAVRPWQHVLDPLFGYLLLVRSLYQNGTAFSGAWNFGPDDEDAKTVSSLVERITEMWGSKASWKLDCSSNLKEARYLKLDCSKAKSKLGWYPRWNLKLALEKTINWYKAYFNRENMLDFTINQIQSYERRIEK